MNDYQDQFYQMMTNLRGSNSRAASTQTEQREDRVITEVINGVITSRPAKKITYLNESKQTSNESEPEIIELGGKSKAASTPAVNPVRGIFEFLNGKLE